MQSRKHDSITDEDVACLVSPGGASSTTRSAWPSKFLDLLSADHHAIDDEFYRTSVSTSRRRRSSSWDSPVPTPWACTVSSTRSTCTGAASPVIPYAPTRSTRPSTSRAPRIGMSQTVLVTGATGLAGANICKLLVERGDTVRALARASADTAPLAALGVDVVTGDVTDPDAVRAAAKGSDAAIHCAALLGGPARTWPTSRR